MLLVRTAIKPSKVSGLGVYTVAPILLGQSVFRFDVRVDRKYSRKEVLEFPLSVQLILYSNMWKSKTSNLYCMHGDNARFINHSTAPNLQITFPHDAQRYGLEHGASAVRTIAAGAELTWDYTQFDALEFKDGNLWDLIRKQFPPDDPAFAGDDRFDEEFYLPSLVEEEVKR